MLEKSASLFSHLKSSDTPWRGDGLRDFFLYRELGIADATHGKVLVQLVNAHSALEQGTGWHRHEVYLPGRPDDGCARTDDGHPYLKLHHMQAGVGLYGVFSGHRWHNEIYPIVRDMIYQMEARRAMGVAPVH